MGYLSTKDVSKLWGISTARIVKLASEGRIDGAKLVGKSWLIPRNAVKPEDGRTKSVKIIRNQPSYHFPLFLIGNSDIEDKSLLSDEEQLLFHAQELSENEKTAEAVSLLEKLISNSSDRYVLIGAYMSLSYIFFAANDFSEAAQTFLKLQLLFVDDFPHKDELLMPLYALESMLLGNNTHNHYSISPLNTYSTGAQIFGIAASAYLPAANRSASGYFDPGVYELACLRLSKDCDYYAEMCVHYFLSLIYLVGNPEYMQIHIHKAISLAAEHKYYHTIRLLYMYNRTVFQHVLKDLPGDIRKIFDNCLSEDSFSLFLTSFSQSPSLSLLEPQDYNLIRCAALKMYNKQIADSMGVTEGTINKRFARLYAKLNVKNKAELLNLYQETTRNLEN